MLEQSENKIMISCKRATELISKEMEEELSFGEKCLLNIHLYICEFCEQFRKQLCVMREVLRKKDMPRLEDKTLSDEAKNRILQRLKDDK